MAQRKRQYFSPGTARTAGSRRARVSSKNPVRPGISRSGSESSFGTQHLLRKRQPTGDLACTKPRAQPRRARDQPHPRDVARFRQRATVLRRWLPRERVESSFSATYPACSRGVKGANSRVMPHAAARWYSWMRPPSRSRRRISLTVDLAAGVSGSGVPRPSPRCGLCLL
jgi:hypothetical protein